MAFDLSGCLVSFFFFRFLGVVHVCGDRLWGLTQQDIQIIIKGGERTCDLQLLS
jgi:hypothetical protein